MPTYAYVCKDCGHAFDVQQSFSDDALTTCPECGGSLRKQFGAVGVVFKGSGFYKTDSRDSGKKSASPAAKDKPAEKSTADAGSSTTKESSSAVSSSSSTTSSDGSAA